MASTRAPRPRPSRQPVDPDEQAPNLRNRIVRQDSVDPKSLTANPDNWRTHSAEQANLMRSMLQRVGWVAPVMVNERTGRIVDGHLRVQIAVEDRQPLVPVDFVNLSEEEEAAVLAVFDPLGALAGIDAEAQAAVLLAAGRESDELQDYLDRMLSEAEAVAGVFDPGSSGSSTDARTALGHNANNVKIVVAGVDLQVVERALASAGTPHRGRALTMICRTFLASIGLDEKGVPDGS